MTRQEAFVQAIGNNHKHEIKEYEVLGSDSTCTLQIDLPGIEPRHARIDFKDSQYCIRDMRTKTGTFLNGSRIMEAFLKDGDLIQLGDTEIRFILPTQILEERTLFSKNILWDQQLQRVPAISSTDLPVLLLGPSGSGKDILAKYIHDHSDRKLAPFVSVNCSALTETLIESELFGHIKGSFTGAISDRKGAFEAARGGTLFLDEIGDLPYGLQAKLLRALENSEIRPVGSDRNIQTDVRIISATHQNLNAKIEDKEFRSDLYFRLNVINLKVPSLVERMEDFDDLFYSLAKTYRVRFTYNTIQKLKEHSWPGNIRELKNVVLRASALFSKQTVEPEQLLFLVDKIPGDIPQNYKPASSVGGMQANVIREIEKQMIIKRLAANKGNQRRTAADLGMPKSTLHDRLKIYNIQVSEFTG
ncbi:MAG: sigma 54-interacting transcriptional regulator [Pseudobdellovibrionaceae bacterium]